MVYRLARVVFAVFLACLAGVFALPMRPTAQQTPVRLIPARSSGAAAAGIQAQPSRPSVLQYFRSRISTQGRMALIVEMRAPVGIGDEPLSAAQELAESAVISDGRGRVLRGLPPQGAALRPFETIPFMALRADAATFEALLVDPDVVSIQEDFAVPPTLAQSVPLVQADLAHAAGYGGAGKTVAILDTGVETWHSAFGSRTVSQACYSGAGDTSQSVCPGGVTSSKSSASGQPCNLGLDNGACAHGTHVAGIAAGTNGVAPSAGIIAIQVFSNIGGLVRAYDSDIASGLERVYALRKTYNIAAANLSLGGGSYTSTCDDESPAVTAIIGKLVSVRIATVIASGNDSLTNAIAFPACIARAVSVGNSTKADAVRASSNAASFLSLLAPGTSITAPVPGNGLGTMTGTSMAAPHVTGAFALLRNKAPGTKVAAGLAALRNTGKSIVDSRNGLTFKRIRIKSALNTLTALPAATTVSPSGTSASLLPTYTWSKVGLSTQYELWVQKQSGGDPVIDAWHQSSAVCGATTCSVTPATTLTANTTYVWYIRTYDYGTGPWSAIRTFTTGALPAKPTLTAPSGTIKTVTPNYTWNKVSGATHYQFFVQVATGGAAIIDKLVKTGDVCASTPCKFTPATELNPGIAYRWRVRGKNATGYGAWSSFMTFTPSALLPGQASLVSPTTALPHQFPTFKWKKVANATQYSLNVRKSGAIVFTGTWVATDICGSTTCEITPAGPLGTGSVTWRIQAKNSTGSGKFTAWRGFSTTANLASGVLTWGANPANLDLHLVTPSGHVYAGAPTYLPFARMAVADSNGGGPEIIVALEGEAGTYRLYVQKVSGTGTLAGSGAKLKVYYGDTLQATLTAPATGTGNFWNICSITDFVLTCPNKITTSAPAISTTTAPRPAPEKTPVRHPTIKR